MNSFEQHGITHLSPSSLNLFAAEPALWVAERLLGKRGPVGAAAHRGNAAEAGVAKVICEGATLEDAQAFAVAEFDRLSALSGDPRRDAEREAIPKFVASATAELLQYGKPTAYQSRVEWLDPALPVPLVGILDFEFAEHGICLDLKTQHKLSGKISPAHARQVSLYTAVSNYEARLCYATPSKVGVYRLENAGDHLKALVKIGVILGNFLSLSKDKHELAQAIAPNLESFYWNDPATRRVAFDVWGI
jgi:hypothetical protein